MLSAPSQVLMRNADWFEQGQWLFINPQDAAIFSELKIPDIQALHQYYDVYEQCQHAQGQHHFGAFPALEDAFDGIVIYLPKAKAQCKMLIAYAHSLLAENGAILLVGENKSGIKSAAKLLEAVAPRANKVDSARHCALFSCVPSEPSQGFNPDDWKTQSSVSVTDISVNLVSLPGVFSHGELDAGTELLLANCPTAKGNVLDFACGAGVIGSFLAAKSPDISLTMTDVSALAVEASHSTLAANQQRGDIIAANGLSDTEKRFDFVYTNPPFHTGIRTDYSVTEAFIKDVWKVMKPKGQLTLVANRFLPYPDLLEARFGNVKTIAQTNKFNLYHVIKT